jgi:predicted XRE-type DNA-binding protein
MSVEGPLRDRLKRAEMAMSNRPKRETRRQKAGEIPTYPSSGNVFWDLGVPDPAQAIVKAELAARITETIEKRGLTQAAAAKILEVDQPSVSDLMRAHLRGFSSDRLFRFLNALGKDVEIVIRPRRRSSSRPQIRIIEAKLAG